MNIHELISLLKSPWTWVCSRPMGTRYCLLLYKMLSRSLCRNLHRFSQVLKGAVGTTLCQNEAELKFSMEISIGNSTSASFWQSVTTTAPFKDWLLRVSTDIQTWILSLWGQIFALISGKCYLIGLVFYPLKYIRSSNKLYRFLFHLTKVISEIYRNLEAPKPLESQAYLITAILDNSEKVSPKTENEWKESTNTTNNWCLGNIGK